MSMTIEEAQKTITFQSNQLRVLSEQHVATIADFQRQHGEIVGPLNEQITVLSETVRALKEEHARLLEQMAAAEARIPKDVAKPAPEPAAAA